MEPSSDADRDVNEPRVYMMHPCCVVSGVVYTAKKVNTPKSRREKKEKSSHSLLVFFFFYLCVLLLVSLAKVLSKPNSAILQKHRLYLTFYNIVWL